MKILAFVLIMFISNGVHGVTTVSNIETKDECERLAALIKKDMWWMDRHLCVEYNKAPQQ